MFCPKCGHQQIGNEVKYCSRCGFYLGMVAELLVLDGAVPGRAISPYSPGPSARKKKIRRAAKLMFFSLVLLPLAIGLSAAVDDGAPMIFPFAVFLVSVFWMLYHRLFTDDVEIPAQAPRQVQMPPQRPMLRPEDNRMGVAEPRRVNTADMAHPPSIVDHTTQLFDKER